MKRLIAILSILLVMAVCAGCANTAAPEASLPENPVSQPENSREVLPLNEENIRKYESVMWELAWNGQLHTTWDGEPKAENLSDVAIEIAKIEREGDRAYVTVNIGSEVYLDLETKEEMLSNNGDNLLLLPNGDPNREIYWPSPMFKIGESEVVLYEGADSVIPLSCKHTRYPELAVSVLKANTEAVRDELEASKKVVDVVESYDPYLLQVLYRTVLANHRWIEQPEDLTLYDLEQLTELNINWNHMGIYANEMEDGENYRMDGSLLRYTPNLQFLNVAVLLQDYSVFKDMDQLVNLSIFMDDLYDAEDKTVPDLSTLKIGKTDNLVLEGFRSDIVVDLNQCDVNNLEVRSWVAGVTEFKGCENLRGFTMLHTRTDTSLINAETFPNAKRISLEFYSDYARFRNLANLGTFGDDVFIDLKLDYQAANNKTVATLDGVRIDRLTLDPASGPWALPEPDPELVGKIDVIPTNVTWLSNPAEASVQTAEE